MTIPVVVSSSRKQRSAMVNARRQHMPRSDSKLEDAFGRMMDRNRPPGSLAAPRERKICAPCYVCPEIESVDTG